ncbi:hypothetical protein TNCV_2387491 [Trichonephila clavipes]|nr:hypothetical protein TNCV_2387491 [Trichonephila clavipes]
MSAPQEASVKLIQEIDVDISIGAPDLRRDLNLLSEHLGNSIEILLLSEHLGNSIEILYLPLVTRSTNGRGFLGQWTSELSTCLEIMKCREGMQSEAGEKLFPLVGLLISHWENESPGRKG